MTVSADYLSYVLEQVASLGRVAPRRLFGGVGLYLEETFFGLIDDDTLFFKTDDSNRADYETRGMRRFNPFPDRPERGPVTLGYHEVPADILEDAEQLSAWALKSVGVARSAAARKLKPRKANTLKLGARKPRGS